MIKYKFELINYLLKDFKKRIKKLIILRPTKIRTIAIKSIDQLDVYIE
jgi:hypothetical protein